MDIANQLFSLTVGVEPNKQTIQTLAGHLNNAVLSLGDKQKELANFANTLENQKFISNAPNEALPLSKPQIQYIEAAPTPQAKQARKAKLLRDPVVWQISEKQMKELQWKQKQLLRAQKAELERKKEARKSRPPPKKLGQSKAALRKSEEDKKKNPPAPPKQQKPPPPPAGAKPGAKPTAGAGKGNAPQQKKPPAPPGTPPKLGQSKAKAK